MVNAQQGKIPVCAPYTGGEIMSTILKMKNITKVFPGVVALDNVCLEFEEGEVHAIVGENGAGKSTFIKILTGAIRPTKGTIELFGKEYDSLTPHEAMEKGISAIYQEFCCRECFFWKRRNQRHFSKQSGDEQKDP